MIYFTSKFQGDSVVKCVRSNSLEEAIDILKGTIEEDGFDITDDDIDSINDFHRCEKDGFIYLIHPVEKTKGRIGQDGRIVYGCNNYRNSGGDVLADLYNEKGEFYRTAVVARCLSNREAQKYCEKKNVLDELGFKHGTYEEETGL